MRQTRQTGQARRLAGNGRKRESKARLRLWLRLLGTSGRIERSLRARMRRQFGTTLPRFDVLAALDRERGGLTMTELSRRLMVSNGNVTGIVDRLAEDGLIVRVPSREDRRATFVRLTERGQQRFSAMAAAHEIWVNEMLGRLSLEETEQLTATMDRLKTLLEDSEQ